MEAGEGVGGGQRVKGIFNLKCEVLHFENPENTKG